MDGSEASGTGPAIKRGRKFDQVLAGARDVFMAQGYEGASVDLIARKAGVSKATLYSYFSDKRVLFFEVARHECSLQADRALQIEDLDLPPREMLTGVAQRMLAFLVSPFAQRIFRICVAESERFPELGREFYISGPKLMEDRLVDYLRHACGRGELRIDDLRMAALQFQELLKADIFVKMIFNILETPDPAEMQHVIDSAVDMFMARYGAVD